MCRRTSKSYPADGAKVMSPVNSNLKQFGSLNLAFETFINLILLIKCHYIWRWNKTNFLKMCTKSTSMLAKQLPFWLCFQSLRIRTWQLERASDHFTGEKMEKQEGFSGPRPTGQSGSLSSSFASLSSGSLGSEGERCCTSKLEIYFLCFSFPSLLHFVWLCCLSFQPPNSIST